MKKSFAVMQFLFLKTKNIDQSMKIFYHANLENYLLYAVPNRNIKIKV